MLLQIAGCINPFQAQKVYREDQKNFAMRELLRDHLSDIFNKIESLLRDVLRISKSNHRYKTGQICLTQVWERYGPLIEEMFSEAQKATLCQVSRWITEENIFAYLICFRPTSESNKNAYSYPNCIKFDFESA